MADQRIICSEEMVGASHPTKSDTLNRLTGIEHSNDGTHGKAITQLTASKLVKANASKILAPSVMTETANGEVTNPSQPAFLALAALQENQIGDGTAYTVQFVTEIFDQNADYNGVETFTAPVTGKYTLMTTVEVSGLAVDHDTMVIKIVTSNRPHLHRVYTTATGANPFLFMGAFKSVLADMDGGDTAYIEIIIYNGTKVVDISANSYFAGVLAC